MLVAIGLFAIVMVVCIGTLLSLVNANKKAQALESVINNLNITLDSMTRGIRAGAAFDGSVGCSDDTGGGPKDCTVSGTRTFSFVPYGGDPAKPTTYAYVDNGTQGCVTSTKTGGCIVRQENGGGFTVMTAPEVAITAMKFYVVGTVSGRNGDIIQPRVIITIQGTAGAGNAKTVTTFHLQTSSTQRLLDL